MKMFLAISMIFSLLMPCEVINGTISEDELIFLSNLFEVSAEKIEETIENLTDEQWNFKPSAEGWSVAQCLDHVIIAEGALMQQIQKALKEKPNDALPTRHLDGWLLSKIADRGNKVKTPLPPRAQLASREQMLKDFRASRQRIAEFLQDRKLPLRLHFGQSPYGPADCYQLLMVIAAHSLRHHAQIEEVLALQKSD